ncbi:MAG: DNA topoisomerase I [Candidatus Woesearchaeota archaeon]
MKELIITEKPKSAQKIASALSNGKASKHSDKGVPYYQFLLGNKTVIVASTVGHIYSLDEKEKSQKREYPVFSIEWKPSHEVQKGSDYTKKYLDVLKKLSKECDEFTVATDYDIEGEVIGYNIIRSVAKKKDANRMKFSTLTPKELKESYEKKTSSIDWPQALAGETRHMLDWYYGINLSRALTSAIQKGGIFKIMSTGRVQAPALHILAKKEREIQAFKPEDYYEIEALLNKSVDFKAQHKKGKFSSKEEAKNIHDNIKGESVSILKDKKSTTNKVAPPNPFDLTTLQTEAYSLFKIKPAKTLEIAQELYVNGLISYPRTSSQQLPASIGYNSIMQQLSKNNNYAKTVSELLKEKNLKPNNGKKTDPAHPAIYPTGQHEPLEGQSYKIYDLIVKRFLSTFGKNAVRETVTLTFDIKGEDFISKGSTTKTKGWFEYYEPYVQRKEEELPLIDINEKVNVKKISLLSKKTQPPKRYTPASIIRELEKRSLGTKATRSTIIETLYDRSYIKGESIEVTEIGMKTDSIMKKYLPRIVDEKLTQSIEEEMETIREDKNKQQKVLEHAKEILIDTIDSFRQKEKGIGTELAESLKMEERKGIVFGDCLECINNNRKDGELTLKKGKYGRFIACSNYPECSLTLKVPPKGILKPTEKKCDKCSYPIALIGNTKKNARELCINPECPTKKEGNGNNDKEDKKCPKCDKGKLLLRTSVYGSFYGCSNYPKCKHTEKA